MRHRSDRSNSIMNSCQHFTTQIGFVPALVLTIGVMATTARGDDSIPIVFVPGTSGSILKFGDGSVFWLDSTSLAPRTFARGGLNPAGGDDGVEKLTVGGIVDSVAFVPPIDTMGELARLQMTPIGAKLTHLPVYADFSAWGRDTFGTKNWFEAPYDWRKGAGAEASARIDAVVEQARQQTGAAKVILVAHSLGGLVCRDYIAGLGRGKVDAIIAVGTPWLGALKTARGLAWGYNFGVGFTTRPNRFLPELYWYARDASNSGQLIRENPPFRLTFLDNAATAQLAANYPCVYQQLPTKDFMALHGKSIVFGSTPEQALATLRAKNPRLFDEALAWRNDRLNGDNFGVAHHLIAASCDPTCDPGEFQDMQMALPGPESLTAEGGSHFDGVNNWVIAQRRKIFDEIKGRGVPLYLDEFVATETEVFLGDGTSALLSATAGAQLRADAPLDLAKPVGFLGEGTKVTSLRLDPRYSHGSMVRDLGVQREVLRAVSARRVAAGMTADTRAAAVGIMTLELTTKGGNYLNGTVDRVVMTLGKTPFATNGWLQNGQWIADSLTSGKTARYDYPLPNNPDPTTGANRPLLRSDVVGKSLVLSKSGFSNWTCAGVKLLIDGQTVLDDRTEFTLRSGVSSREITIPAR